MTIQGWLTKGYNDIGYSGHAVGQDRCAGPTYSIELPVVLLGEAEEDIQ
jgi:hypothetical protein